MRYACMRAQGARAHPEGSALSGSALMALARCAIASTLAMVMARSATCCKQSPQAVTASNHRARAQVRVAWAGPH